MPVFHPPFMALNVTYVGLVLVEKSCAIFSPVLLAILKSWRIVCASPKEIEFVFQPVTKQRRLEEWELAVRLGLSRMAAPLTTTTTTMVAGTESERN